MRSEGHRQLRKDYHSISTKVRMRPARYACEGTVPSGDLESVPTPAVAYASGGRIMLVKILVSLTIRFLAIGRWLSREELCMLVVRMVLEARGMST